METKNDISYGVVPLYQDGGEWKVLVIHQISHRGDRFWIFPKGHGEVGELPAEAALRELHEETKLKVPKPVLFGSIVNEMVADEPYRDGHLHSPGRPAGHSGAWSIAGHAGAVD